jgi:hypothetical protein
MGPRPPDTSRTSESDYGMTLKWRKLSRTPDGAAQILNLIWTDITSFVSVGTKTGFEDSGLLRSSTSSSPSPKSNILGTRLVHRNVRVIKYRDIRYAIPAFLAMGLLVVGLAGALIICLFCMVTSRELIHYLNHPRLSPKSLHYQGWTIPPRTPVPMTIVDHNHDEEIFPDSHSFLPERWLENKTRSGADLDHYFFSFGKGSRSCVWYQVSFSPSPPNENVT